jgi:hypothetical protein
LEEIPERPLLPLLNRFEIGDDRPYVLGLEDEFGHVRMADQQAFSQGFLQTIDRIFA